MGIPLYSLRYTSEPTIRTEPEPKVDICETWSANRFDPDSEEFFHDAPYEAFLTQEQLDRERAEVAISTLTSAEGVISSASSDTSEDSGSDAGSPTATGSEDIPQLITDSYRSPSPLDWELEYWGLPVYAPTPTTNSTLTIPSRVASAQSPAPTDQLGNPAFIPPAAFREATPDITEPLPLTIESSSPVRRRPINIVPIVVSQRTQPQSLPQPSSEPPQAVIEQTAVEAPSVPRPASPAPLSVPTTIVNPPSTPPPQRVQAMYTPSPPPTVTPRFYSWGRYPITTAIRTPASPSLVRDGPFTNPRARMSFARIDASPVRIRIPNHVL